MKLIRYEYPQTTNSLSNLFDFGVPSVKRFGELLDDFWNSENDTGQLAANLHEDDKSFFVQMEIPGVSKDVINLELENAVLICSGNYSEETKNGKTNFSFNRTISVPDGVALDKISANYEHGVLTIKMPKSPESKPHQIKIK